MRNKNTENESKSVGPNSAIKNVIKKTAIKSTKYCLAVLLTKYT